jgi:hypothetical protein
MPMAITSVRHSAQWDSLHVAVDDAALRAKPGIGR